MVQVIAGTAISDAPIEAERSELESDALLRDPARVFALRLDAEEAITAEERERLELAFRELHEQLDGDVRLRLRIGGDALLLLVAGNALAAADALGILAPHGETVDVRRVERAQGL